MIRESATLKDEDLHDNVQQHLRALKVIWAMNLPDLSSLKLKLDTNTLFEWQVCHRIGVFASSFAANNYGCPTECH